MSTLRTEDVGLSRISEDFEREKMENRIEDINGVECEIVEFCPPDGEIVRLVIPHKVRGLGLLEFVLSSYSEKARDPETAQAYAFISIALYDKACYEHLLNKRMFDIFSLSSAFYKHQLKELSQLAKICPTALLLEDEVKRGLHRDIGVKPEAMTLCDNVQRMCQLGHPTARKSWEDLLRGAIYQCPESIPHIDATDDFDRAIRREFENLERRRLGMMATGDKAWEEIERECFQRFTSLLLFRAEKTAFDVLHQAMDKIHGMIESELSPSESHWFRWWNQRNPKYLNRILRFDPSPVWPSFARIVTQIYQGFGARVAREVLGPEEVGELVIAFLNFYPVWLRYILDDEAERREGKRRAEEIEKVVKEHRDDKIRPEERTDSVSHHEDAVEDPKYAKYPLAMILFEAGIPWDASKRDLKEPTPSRAKRKRREPKAIPADVRKRIIGLEAEGAPNKEIARVLQVSPSYASKLRKRIDRESESIRKKLYRPLLEGYYRNFKKMFDELPADKKAGFRESHVADIKKFAGQICKHAHLSREDLEKDLIPPCLRE